jgi:hypothetical protein
MKSICGFESMLNDSDLAEAKTFRQQVEALARICARATHKLESDPEKSSADQPSNPQDSSGRKSRIR